uniref:Calponin-homology (CH) domain-containing protein n=1 Tax=Glossina brevipalpis TaxID=37001 RepID=A0A1A9X0A7_9MUSC
MSGLNRPKSPYVSNTIRSGEGFWDKFSTLGRKKETKAVQKVEEEGKNAIDYPGSPYQFDIPPEDYALRDHEQRAVIDPQSLNDPEVRKLQQVLIDWINDELAEQRIIVFHKLWEKLAGKKLDVPEVTQSEEGQLRHFRAPVRLPENVFVTVVIAQKNSGVLNAQKFQEQVTSEYDDVGMRCEKDAFDTLFDCAPDKLTVVKKSLITFVNKHLSKLNFEINELSTDFHDGVYLCLLMGLLGGFFVPLKEFHLTPQDADQMVSNVAFSFALMQDVGLPRPKARPEDIVNMDLKSTLRVLYSLFTTFRNYA